MDTSENYLKMCKKFFDKHPEILKLNNWKHNVFYIPDDKKHTCRIGNFMITTNEIADIDKIYNDENKVPILTIDESIFLISGKIQNLKVLADLFNKFMNCGKKPAFYEKYTYSSKELIKLQNQRNKYTTYDQAIFGFMVHFLYKEIWNDENWISESRFTK